MLRQCLAASLGEFGIVYREATFGEGLYIQDRCPQAL
jgi:hypothetical protein